MLRRGRVPFRSDELRALLNSYIGWSCEHRPHQGLGGRTPDEVYFGVEPAIDPGDKNEQVAYRLRVDIDP